MLLLLMIAKIQNPKKEIVAFHPIAFVDSVDGNIEKSTQT